MTLQPSPGAKFNTYCSSCGVSFRCGFRGGETHCWCADLPRLVPVPGESCTACLCEACLRAELERRAEGVEGGLHVCASRKPVEGNADDLARA